MMGSGIQPNDRILWADGEVVFSAPQFSALINESTTFLTVQRGNEIFQTKVPRVQIDDLKMSAYEKGEIDDWQHEAGIRGRIQDLYFVPYNLSPNASVESRLEFIDEEDQTKAFKRCERCAYFNPLQEGDQILAVDGQPIRSSYELLERLQSRHALVIVERNPEAIQILWDQADPQFDQFNISNLEAIVSSIGTDQPVTSSESLHLLNSVVPKPFNELTLSPEQKAHFVQELAQNKKEIEAIQDPQKKIEALDALEKNQRRVILGIPLKDGMFSTILTPAQQFIDVFKDTYRTLFGLVSGYLNPKYVSGPVGIVQVVHHSWMVGGKEALYWMAVISLNLGLINLLPIPVLDGGTSFFL